MEFSYQTILFILVGVAIGYVVSYIKSRFEIRDYKLELKGFQEHLNRQMLKAPGFSSAWEVALQESEREYEENEKGFKSIIKKVFGPSITQHSEVTPHTELQKEGFGHR